VIRLLLQVLWGLEVLICLAAVGLHINGYLYAQAQLQVLRRRRLNGVFRVMVKRLRRSSLIRLAAKSLLGLIGALAIIGVSQLPGTLTFADPRAPRSLASVLSALLLASLLTVDASLDYRARARIADLAIAEPLLGLGGEEEEESNG
jgi:hypothetical protein